ncbi:hypothetical protein GCM10010210_29270 [Pseudonocardia hydrocarbonoxydans]|uniref:FAD/NAD(P)-binding domain-containing protein n=1 Tax=Pseudonocardia hydrocarbonoxydans TaxID=76726 RepID=A0A4Y3WIR5_9PSEU|nr:hypothetical protein PHY01_09180 [Pseudonocardia hydrocarbonoxydans]
MPARVVLACLGVEPATGWLHGNDVTAPGGGGVLVDAAQRAPERPGLYAVGDLAAFPGPDGQTVRVEHWGAALGQAAVAATTLLTDLGIPAAADLPARAPVPGYSTYVHGVKLTILGWPATAVTDRPVLGRVGDPRFAVALLDAADRVVAAVGVGGARAALFHPGAGAMVACAAPAGREALPLAVFSAVGTAGAALVPIAVLTGVDTLGAAATLPHRGGPARPHRRTAVLPHRPRRGPTPHAWHLTRSVTRAGRRVA